jgi:hypothetical protein
VLLVGKTIFLHPPPLLPGIIDGNGSVSGGRGAFTVRTALPSDGSTTALADELVLEGSVGGHGDSDKPHWVSVSIGQGTDGARVGPVGKRVDATSKVDIF